MTKTKDGDGATRKRGNFTVGLEPLVRGGGGGRLVRVGGGGAARGAHFHWLSLQNPRLTYSSPEKRGQGTYIPQFEGIKGYLRPTELHLCQESPPHR